MHYEDLLYVDVDFLSGKYEEQTGIMPDTVVTKNEGMDAQASITFLKSKLHSQVTKQFRSSNRTMLKAVENALNAYPFYDESLEVGLPPKNVWVNGRLTIGQWGDELNSDTATNVFYEVDSDQIKYTLLPQTEYFLANLQGLEVITPALRRYIQIPVKMLCKVLYPLPDIKTVVVAPYLILADSQQGGTHTI